MSERRFLNDSYSERTAEETRARYDEWAESYDAELADNGYATPALSLAAFRDAVSTADATILDVGCGTGLFGRLLVDAGYATVDGCDYSPGMLAKAAETGCYRHLFEVNLNEPPLRRDGSAVATDFYDAASVVGVFSFGHVKAEAMDEIARVVRPGGAIVIGLNEKFWNEGSLRTKLEAMEANGALTITACQPGDHLPSTGLTGWFISLAVG